MPVNASVTWNLMIGRNPLWVANAAWIEAAKDGDVEVIKHSILSPVAKPIRMQTGVVTIGCYGAIWH